MTTIDPTVQLAALIRNQIASLKRPATLAGQNRTGARARSAKHVGEQQDIASLVARRVAVIDAEDPQRERKAFKIFLESVLIAEFGDGLANDPAFHVMVEEVQRQMESDPELALSMKQASRVLLREDGA
ncbi:hypothetical protein G5S34_20075 [Herbaspirillum frisingense]|uniref:hypothetical protein n=1 Tax=Herbaspirillum frisingense TaxID=92645 RepID=UPI0016042BE1|nr:hypothetical protein [Herbaspirillum frisingense]QNB08825.1 hypothetical protein G5S34_20075 [Herbaspirillum frisingense]